MSYTQRIEYETMRSADTASAATYLALGTALSHPASLVKMVNLSNKNLIVTTDPSISAGQDICPAGGFWLYDITANDPKSNDIFASQGRQYFVKTSDGAAGTGLVYLVVQYIVQV